MGNWDEYCQVNYGNKECKTGQKVTKRSHGGGRRFRSPIEINTLSDIEALYGEDENPMSDRIGDDDIVCFQLTGVEATGEELMRHTAGQRLVNFARRHQARHGGTLQEALQVAYRLNPEIVRAYLNVEFPRQKEDQTLWP